MSLGEDDCNKLGVRAERLTSMPKFEVVDRRMDPSVGRFKSCKTWRLSLDKNGPPPGLTRMSLDKNGPPKIDDIVAKSIAPECNYGVLTTVNHHRQGAREIVDGKLQL